MCPLAISAGLSPAISLQHLYFLLSPQGRPPRPCARGPEDGPVQILEKIIQGVFP
jgi:hypothetical protein